jgi:hypothetical protein
MKYIFIAGAPGSKWSSVAKNIYYSPDIDRSDYRDEWTYYHDASGKRDLMHLGAYFDPGMECDLPEAVDFHGKASLEAIFDAPFAKEANGIRIIKSHVFCNHIDFLRKTWPECPVVLVQRSDDACLGWWVKCGHFNITYPLYHEYYVDLKTMAQRIQQQNKNLVESWTEYGQDLAMPTNNHQLCRALAIATPPREYKQNYIENDVTVKVIMT